MPPVSPAPIGHDPCVAVATLAARVKQHVKDVLHLVHDKDVLHLVHDKDVLHLVHVKDVLHLATSVRCEDEDRRGRVSHFQPAN